jgi:hypothetical protein
MQPVEVRRLKNGVAVAGQISITLIVSHHDDDVVRLCAEFGNCQAAQYR